MIMRTFPIKSQGIKWTILIYFIYDISLILEEILLFNILVQFREVIIHRPILKRLGLLF